MTSTLLLLIQEIFNLAAGIVAGLIPGAQRDIDIAAALLAIVQKGIAAYQEQAGQPIDPALLKPFEPIE